jgi:long-chain acyl-CoA synthetase
MEITRTFDLLDRYEAMFMKDVALAVKLNRQWVNYSTREYLDYACHFAYGLLARGFRKGDKIASVSANRPEWNFIDIGMAMAGVVHVPLYTSLTPEEYENILRHADAKYLMISDKVLWKKIKPIAEKISTIEGVYTFDEIEGEKHWKEITELGRQEAEMRHAELETIKASIQPDDFATLIYTSGTTGNSKGVMLSHRNLVQNFLAAVDVFSLTPDQKYMNILPLCHVGGRLGNYQTQYSGCTIYYPENMGTIAADMRDVQPHGFDAVPRILEKIFDTIVAKGKKLKGLKKRIFFWAVDLGLRYRIPEESTLLYKLQLRIADKLIFSKWREAIGGNAQLVGCGGAALQPRVERVFWAAGIKVLNMYGLTETSPVITINRKTKPGLKLGTVGAIIPGVELRIADDGEIQCRGHNVMLGYYKNPDMTREAFTHDGWFKTGDIGSIEEGKYLRVTDRKKEIFKLSCGKFIAPQILENKFKESLFIEQLMVIGEHEKFASALIAPDFNYVKEWFTGKNLEYSDPASAIANQTLLETISREVDQFNKTMSDFEKIKRFRVVSDVWSPETGELSPTLKLRRSFVTSKYKGLIDQIYSKTN